MGRIWAGGRLRDPWKPGPSVHVAAGIGLCRATGCILTDLRGAPLRLTHEGMVVAADAETHALLLNGIRGDLVPLDA